MSWNPKNTMSLRLELVTLAKTGGIPFNALCERFGVSPKTGYKWLRRHEAGGDDALRDLPRRPKRSPERTPEAVEEAVAAARRQRPAWGPRKLAHLLKAGGVEPPAFSTIAAIIVRQGLAATSGVVGAGPFTRFEKEEPNELWQMDFKGHIAMGASRLHPLTLIDDHSRYLVGLYACERETTVTVQRHLTHAFRRYGLPWRILCDHGSPWSHPPEGDTVLSVWLTKLGVRITHGRVRHPQTQGKCERFHRTLKSELLQRTDWKTLGESATRFEDYRTDYNHRRPHEALGYSAPATRYRVSPRAFPEKLPEPEYLDGDDLFRVKGKGEIMVRGRHWYLGESFAGETVALRPQGDGLYAVYFAHRRLGYIDERIRDDLPRHHYRQLLKPDENDLE